MPPLFKGSRLTADIKQLENELLAAIASAKDEAGLEAVRVVGLP